MDRRVIVVESAETMASRAAELITERAERAIAARGRFSLALAGGSTVRGPYQRLAQAKGIDWTKVLVFWGDERFVDLDNPYSNHRESVVSLLSHVPIPGGNIFPVNVNAPTPAVGADEYGATIRRALGAAGDALPVFDLVQLGMGPDGHTASLFPHSDALKPGAGIVRMNHAGLSPWVDRVTFSLDLINASRCVLFMASGSNKAAKLKAVLESSGVSAEDLPTSGVKPANGELIWLIDAPSAAQLSPTTATG